MGHHGVRILQGLEVMVGGSWHWSPISTRCFLHFTTGMRLDGSVACGQEQHHDVARALHRGEGPVYHTSAREGRGCAVCVFLCVCFVVFTHNVSTRFPAPLLPSCDNAIIITSSHRHVIMAGRRHMLPTSSHNTPYHIIATPLCLRGSHFRRRHL